MNDYKYFLSNKYTGNDLDMKGGCMPDIPICIDESNNIKIKNHPKVFIFDKQDDIPNLDTSSTNSIGDIEIIKTKYKVYKVYKHTKSKFEYIHPLLKKIGIKNQSNNDYIFNIYDYGVLGYNIKSQEKNNNLNNVDRFKQITYTQKDMALIDAANCGNLKNATGVENARADGVSGAIYTLLKEKKYTTQNVSHLTKEATKSCKYLGGFVQLRIYKNNYNNIINIFHTVGPHISESIREPELNLLYSVYKNLFLKYIEHLRDKSQNKIFVLRLLPISAEIFGGYKYDKFSELTFAIILAAFNDLERDDQYLFLNKCKLIEFCLFKRIYEPQSRSIFSDVPYLAKFNYLHNKYIYKKFDLTESESEIQIPPMYNITGEESLDDIIKFNNTQRLIYRLKHKNPIQFSSVQQRIESLADPADPKALDYDGGTTLIFASRIPDYHETVEYLIKKGVNVNATTMREENYYGYTALMVAVSYGIHNYHKYKNTILTILKYNPNLEIKSKKDEQTALMMTATARKDKLPTDLITELVKAGANIDTQDNTGKTYRQYMSDHLRKHHAKDRAGVDQVAKLLDITDYKYTSPSN